MNLKSRKGQSEKGKIDWIIAGFGFSEITIGFAAFFSLLISLLLQTSTKTFGVAVFVAITAVMSVSLGIGLLRHNLLCYNLLIFFAKVIIISKIAIFLKVIRLNGALETTMPSEAKNIISIIYHSILIIYLRMYLKRQACKKQHE